MKTVTIDFTNVKYLGEIHQKIKKAFQDGTKGFPDFYGENLDALWDCLIGFIELPVEIKVTGINTADISMKDDIFEVIEIFKRAASVRDEILLIIE